MLSGEQGRGVKYCQVVAAVAKVPESHHNLSVLLEKMQVPMIHCYVALMGSLSSERQITYVSGELHFVPCGERSQVYQHHAGPADSHLQVPLPLLLVYGCGSLVCYSKWGYLN